MKQLFFSGIFLTFTLLGFSQQAVIQGINLVSPKEQPEFDFVKPIKKTDANWIALTPYAFMVPGDPEIYYNTTENWWGDRPGNIEQVIAAAKKQDFKILLKPHFWVDQQGWAGDYDLDMVDWEIWKKNYSNFMMQMAWLCEREDIEMLCIGVEMKTCVAKNPEFWGELIADIRDLYSGQLTYAANWDNFQNIPFWEALDFIGIDAYFPLVNKKTPEVDALKKAWKTPLKNCAAIAEQFDKKIIFTEFGYRSCNFACWEQWHIEGLEPTEELNLKAQENGYTALFETVWNQPWFAGGFAWKWFPEKNAGGPKNSDYTPQDKPVLKLIKEWYK